MTNIARQCCCGAEGPANWIQVVSCDCGYTRFVPVADEYFSCSPEGKGPPPIGSVLREAVDSEGLQPGGCWTVVDHWDAPPDGAATMANVFEPTCVSGCSDESCVDYSSSCPACDWHICNGWQNADAGDCGYISKHAYIGRLVALAVGEMSLQFQYRFWTGGVLQSARDCLATYDALQWTVWDWTAGAPAFVSQTLQLTTRMQYSESGPSHGAGCSFDQSININATITDDADWYATTCGDIPGILVDPVVCGDEPIKLAYSTHAFSEVFGACSAYTSCVNPAVAAIMFSREYVENVLPQDGSCLEEETVYDHHENTIGGNGCGVSLDQVETATRYFRPWMFTRTSRTWAEDRDDYGGCTTGGPTDREWWRTRFSGAISGRAFWLLCDELPASLMARPSGLVVPKQPRVLPARLSKFRDGSKGRSVASATKVPMDPRVTGLTAEANTPRGCCGRD
ncbi:MAG: hypothetical protein KJZ65_06750 [Phycisphaerales bacterium]|nr:hypothetical protein [Phycisphaerales bacterium]